MTNLLEAEFSEEGSNNRRFEKCCQCKNCEEPEGSSKSVEWFSIEGRKTETRVTISPFPTHIAWLIQIQFHLNSKYKPLFTYSDILLPLKFAGCNLWKLQPLLSLQQILSLSFLKTNCSTCMTLCCLMLALVTCNTRKSKGDHFW